MRLRRGTKDAILVLLAFAVAGCGRSCKNDHPYVPYAIEDARAPQMESDAAAASTVEPIDAGPAPSTSEPALVAPAGATSWSVEGIELAAPTGRELVMAIVRDFDGDGRKDALALARPPASPDGPNDGRRIEIVHYAGALPSPVASVVATAPGVRFDAGCTEIVRLERVGPRSAFAEVGASCPTGSASRALYVVRLARSSAVAFDLGILDPPGAPRLGVDVDGRDRDRDGIDDVTLRMTIEGGSAPFEPGPKLSASVAFFDRPAGASRDPDEPAASLRAIATQAAARAAKAKDAPAVPLVVQQMRMLFRAMCIEGGAPRLVKLRGMPPPGAASNGTGGAISCGASKALEDAGVAEVRALALQANALRAIAAAEAAQTPPATKTAARTTELATLIAGVAPFVQARSSRTVIAPALPARGAHPEWGALAFEPSGKLLVRTTGQVLRVDPESGEASDAGMAPWPAHVLSPDGKSRWLEAYHACEGVALRATFAPTGAEGEMRDVLLPIAPPLGSRCAGGRGEAATTVPIAWGARGLEALVAGVPLLVRAETATATVMASPLGEPPLLGSPRSPGGAAMAVATSRGVLVTTTKSVLVQSPALEPYPDLRQCTTTDSATRIACVKRGQVVMAAIDTPP